MFNKILHYFKTKNGPKCILSIIGISISPLVFGFINIDGFIGDVVFTIYIGIMAVFAVHYFDCKNEDFF